MRVVAWFSCGAASAVAAKLTVDKYGDRAVVVYCDTMADEHPDNARFFAAVQEWLGVEIERIRSAKYASVEDVFTARRYMAGVAGAICTTEMKKLPRFAFQRPDDMHVFGLTADEGGRIARFEATNPELMLEWPLRDRFITKQRALGILTEAGIALPAMYALGFRNNNCIGCVKATAPGYWNAVRMHFPEVFARRATLSRAINARLVRVDGRRVFLDELPEDDRSGQMEDVSCGPECGR